MGRKKKLKKRGRKKTKVLSNKTITQNTIKADSEKTQIKKIKKQPTEKRIYNIKDYVVYAKHGVGKIVAIEKATIGNIDISFYKVFIEKERKV